MKLDLQIYLVDGGDTYRSFLSGKACGWFLWAGMLTVGQVSWTTEAKGMDVEELNTEVNDII